MCGSVQPNERVEALYAWRDGVRKEDAHGRYRAYSTKGKLDTDRHVRVLFGLLSLTDGSAAAAACVVCESVESDVCERVAVAYSSNSVRHQVL